MSPILPIHRLTVFLTFAALVAAAAPLGWGRLPQDEIRGRAAFLQEVEEEMRSRAFLHHRASMPEYSKSASFCRECHAFPPHQGKGLSPAFLNHHALGIGCLVCHWAGVSGPRPDLVWVRWASRETDSLQLNSLAEGRETDTSRIREEVVRRQVCFDRGPECADCHRPGGMDDYTRAGMSPGEIAELEDLEDFFALPPGEKWYFPRMQ